MPQRHVGGARKGATAKVSTHPSRPVSTNRHHQKSTPKPSECFRCARPHNPDTCPARNWTCHNCQRVGHAAKVCRSKKVVNHTAEVPETEDDRLVESVFNVAFPSVSRAALNAPPSDTVNSTSGNHPFSDDVQIGFASASVQRDSSVLSNLQSYLLWIFAAVFNLITFNPAKLLASLLAFSAICVGLAHAKGTELVKSNLGYVSNLFSPYRVERSPPVLKSMLIQDVSVNMEFDSGAGVSLMPLHLYNGRLARVFFDAPGYGTQTDGRHFRLECEPGRARSSGAERNREGPKGAEWSRVEPTERLAWGMRGRYFRLDAMFQPATGGKNSR